MVKKKRTSRIERSIKKLLRNNKLFCFRSKLRRSGVTKLYKLLQAEFTQLFKHFIIKQYLYILKLSLIKTSWEELI